MSVEGKWSITSGSALSAAYAGLSSSLQGRTSSRAVCRCGASVIAVPRSSVGGEHVERLTGGGGIDTSDHLDA